MFLGVAILSKKGFRSIQLRALCMPASVPASVSKLTRQKFSNILSSKSCPSESIIPTGASEIGNTVMIQSLPTRRHSSFQGWIGTAREDITPPVGIYARNWGAALHDVALSIHRPLSLTALSIAPAADACGLMLIDADLGWWKTPHVFEKVQARLLQELGLEAAQLIFALTHTHAGPPLMEASHDLPGGDLIAPWMDRVVEAAIAAARRARQVSQAAVLDWHTGRCSLAAYRDLPDPASSDKQRWICGFNPQGQPDDTLVVGRVTNQSGEILATLVNYACHPTTLAWDNTAISPDYIGAMRATMERDTGAPALFLQGASGELSPRHQYTGDTRIADQHGRQLGHAALATLLDMEPPGQAFAYQTTVESGAPLAIWSHESAESSIVQSAKTAIVELPVKAWPTARQLESERAACTDRAVQERLRRKRDIRTALGDGNTYELPIWAWRLGDAAVVGCCCEAYSTLQLTLRQRFPHQTIVCVNLINGSLGYLPPHSVYDQDLYQVWQTPFDRGSLEEVIEAMSGVLSGWFMADL